MALVGVFRPPTFGHKQHPGEQEEQALTPSQPRASPAAPTEGAFQHQLSKGTELWAGPATQPPLHFLPGTTPGTDRPGWWRTHTGQNRGVSDRILLLSPVPQLGPRLASPAHPGGHLQASCMLLLALHVIDVPGHCSHGHNSFLYHLSPSGVWALRPVFAQFLTVIQQGVQGEGEKEKEN